MNYDIEKHLKIRYKTSELMGWTYITISLTLQKGRKAKFCLKRPIITSGFIVPKLKV